MGGFGPLSNTNCVPRRSRILGRAGVLRVRDFELGRLRWIPIVSRGDLRENNADLKRLMAWLQQLRRANVLDAFASPEPMNPPTRDLSKDYLVALHLPAFGPWSNIRLHGRTPG